MTSFVGAIIVTLVGSIGSSVVAVLQELRRRHRNASVEVRIVDDDGESQILTVQAQDAVHAAQLIEDALGRRFGTSGGASRSSA